MKIYKDIIQRSDEWKELKKLHLSASHAKEIVTNGKTLENYVNDLVVEFISGVAENYTNFAMQYGIENEPLAREKANEITGLEFQEIGAVELNNRCLVSPDGAIFDDKDNIKEICELKCPQPKRFIEQIMTDKIPIEYIYQMNLQMFVCNVQRCFYLAYNKDVKPYVFYKWITPDAEIQEKLIKGLKRGSELIDSLLFEYFEKVEK